MSFILFGTFVINVILSRGETSYLFAWICLAFYSMSIPFSLWNISSDETIHADEVVSLNRGSVFWLLVVESSLLILGVGAALYTVLNQPSAPYLALLGFGSLIMQAIAYDIVLGAKSYVKRWK